MPARLSTLVHRESVRLDARADDRLDAVRQAGAALVEAGAVHPSYVDSMLRRESTVSTYVGEGIALPHGTISGKSAVLQDALSVLRFPDGVDWNGETVTVVIGIAALEGGHIALLARLADILLDEVRASALHRAESVGDVLAVLETEEH